MTPKEKAIDLVNKFYSRYNNVRKNKTFSVEQKRMAIIAVDEILKLNHPYVIVYESFKDNVMDIMTQKHYWQEVKTELEKL
jgi:hypothetical protein